jgi:hypothetical protein
VSLWLDRIDNVSIKRESEKRNKAQAKNPRMVVAAKELKPSISPL